MALDGADIEHNQKLCADITMTSEYVLTSLLYRHIIFDYAQCLHRLNVCTVSSGRFTDFRLSDFRLSHIRQPPFAYQTFACQGRTLAYQTFAYLQIPDICLSGQLNQGFSLCIQNLTQVQILV